MSMVAGAAQPQSSTQANAQSLPDAVPTHVGIIMDGNGRWAKRRGMPRLAGHHAGTENVRRITIACE